MNGKAAKVLFIVAFGICVILLFFPFAQITKEKTNVDFIKHIDYYLWGIHTYGSGTFESTKNAWTIYINPESSEINTFLAISFIFLLAGMLMGIWTIYYYLKKLDVAPNFSWLAIISLVLSLLFFRIGITDIEGSFISDAKLYNYSVSSGYFSSFYIFNLGIIFMILSYGFSLFDLSQKEGIEKRMDTKSKDFYDWDIDIKHDKEEKGYANIPIALIAAGVFILAFGIFALLITYSALSNPDVNVQIAGMIGVLSGIAGLIVGIAATVKGFIDYVAKKEPAMDEGGYFKLSIIFLILTWLIFPMIFGPFSVYFGYIIYSKWNKSKGAIIMIFGIIFTLVSYIIGVISMQSLLK